MNHMDMLTGWIDVSKYNGVTSPDYRVLILNDESISNSRYYLYMFQMCYFNKIFYRVRSYGEQCEIADYLDTRIKEIDLLIMAKEKLV